MSCIDQGQPEVFETWHNCLSEVAPLQEYESENQWTLERAKTVFGKVSLEHGEEDTWICKFFRGRVFPSSQIINQRKKEKLIELPTDTTLEIEFKLKSFVNFWEDSSKEYTQLSDKAL